MVIACACFTAGAIIGARTQTISSLLFCKIRTVCFSGNRYSLEGKVYLPRWSFKRKYPAILFCHGMLPKGKSTKLYSHLMRQLAHKGYLVMGFDLRGFGSSSEIDETMTPADLDFVADSKAALSYMLQELPIDKDSVTIAGHSMGANLAFAVGAQDERVKNIIAISPGDFTGYELPSTNAWFAKKLGHMTNLQVAVGDWERLSKPLVMYQYLPLSSSKNILIVRSDIEVRHNISGTGKVYDKLAARKELLIIHNSNHNFGFDLYTGNDLIDPKPLNTLAAAIDEWLKKQALVNNLNSTSTPIPGQKSAF
jgi:pimeloyl-ACP methyl ester carboxylesterase